MFKIPLEKNNVQYSDGKNQVLKCSKFQMENMKCSTFLWKIWNVQNSCESDEL